MRKTIIKIMTILLTMSSLLTTSACSNGGGKLSYYSYDSNDKEVNKSLFYVNSSNEWGADPSILYCTEGEYAGNYFIYATSGYINTAGLQVWKSKNLTDWECMGNAFMPDVDVNWAYKGFWAPQCIYDEEYEKYFMFYSAPWGSDGTLRYDSCCVADSPVGPFYEITSDTKTAAEPVLQFELHTDEFDSRYFSEQVGHYGVSGFIKVIGPSPFIDPETGKRYLFFVSDLGTSGAEASGAYCIEMEDWATPKYETLKRITSFGYRTTEEKEEISEGGSTNEGPMCFYKDGKYYLIFLTYTYFNAKYQTRAAVADNVMGPYEKFEIDNGAQVIYTEPNFQRQAVGIHGLTQAGDSTMSAYMTFKNNKEYDGSRKFAVDEVAWVENEDGILVMQANGPSVTPQPLPEAISGYRNMAKEATITSDNTRAGSDVKYLVDGVIPYHDNSLAPEYKANGDTTTITFDFDDYVSLRAVMVYNSKDYNEMFNQVEKITFDYIKNGKTGTVSIGPVEYNWDYYNFEENKPAVGSACIAEFASLDVNKVTIEIVNPDNPYGIAIPEIVLLGKDADGSSANEGKTGALYDKYSFENEVVTPDWKNCDANLNIDGDLDEEYGAPVYRLYTSATEETDTYTDLYIYRDELGVYAFCDVHDANLVYDPKASVAENSDILIMFSSRDMGLVDKHCVAFKVDPSGESQRSIGVRSQRAWLRSWFTGAHAAKLKSGTLEDVTVSPGYTVETFIPYESLGYESKADFDSMRIYLEMHCIEDTGVIKRELNTVAKKASKTDPSTWLKLKFED